MKEPQEELFGREVRERTSRYELADIYRQEFRKNLTMDTVRVPQDADRVAKLEAALESSAMALRNVRALGSRFDDHASKESIAWRDGAIQGNAERGLRAIREAGFNVSVRSQTRNAQHSR